MALFPRPPQLPPRPREVATQVVKQKQSGAIDTRVIVLKNMIHLQVLPIREGSVTEEPK